MNVLTRRKEKMVADNMGLIFAPTSFCGALAD